MIVLLKCNHINTHEHIQRTTCIYRSHFRNKYEPHEQGVEKKKSLARRKRSAGCNGGKINDVDGEFSGGAFDSGAGKEYTHYSSITFYCQWWGPCSAHQLFRTSTHSSHRHAEVALWRFHGFRAWEAWPCLSRVGLLPGTYLCRFGSY